MSLYVKPGKAFSEAETCEQLVIPALRAAGWDSSTQIKRDVLLDKDAVHVAGKQFRAGPRWRADFVLYKKPDHPLAILEVKSVDQSPSEGVKQALRYAELLDVPIVYSSNGFEIIEQNRTQSNFTPISIAAFPSPKELWADYCIWKGIDDDGSKENLARRTGEIIIRTAMQQYAALLAEQPNELLQMEWRDLERVLREVFERLGFGTTLTRPGKDGGFDLELTTTENGESLTFLVEVKHWDEPNRPGQKVYNSFLEVVVGQSATRGLLLSTSGFTNNIFTGITEFQRQRVKLGKGEKIISLCKTFHKLVSGLWVNVDSLSETLFDATI